LFVQLLLLLSCAGSDACCCAVLHEQAAALAQDAFQEQIAELIRSALLAGVHHVATAYLHFKTFFISASVAGSTASDLRPCACR
jgi:hypothetical protein